MQNKQKTPSQSFTTQVHIVSHADLNGYKRLFGGKIMSWIDIVAGVAARRHSECNVTTVAVDDLRFLKSARANDMIVLEAAVTYTGRTSMEVHVKTFVEENSGARTLINDAYLVMVALDENERPTPVPRLVPETEEEKQEYEAGKARQAARLARA